MVLNKSGEIVKAVIEDFNKRYPEARIDKYVIMPNHIHLIILVENGSAIREEPLRKRSLTSVIVGAIKMTASKKMRISNDTINQIWQRGYHDHIIRNEDEYLRIWNYIDTNPAKWYEDRYYAITL
jgi:REP element-mobilizing transposase RayT